MRRTLLLAALTAVATVGPLAAVPTAAAQPPPVAVGREGETGNGPERNEVAAVAPQPAPFTAAAPVDSQVGPDVARGYPRRTALTMPPVDPADASIRLGLAPYHDLAPRLDALQRSTDRVSVEVIGRSVRGRDLYLVTVTAPETLAQDRDQIRLRERIQSQPADAARDRDLARRYKAPYFVNANIHGNEWEGTDAALRVVEELARATDANTARLLQRTRVYAVVTANPDGRVAGTRANAAGFDMNRDFVTVSQPEVVAVRDALRGAQPLVMLDQHGYVAGTLIEPGTAPHGRDYEYDLYIRHALANAEGMEAALESLNLGPEVDPVIPFRDYEPGDWDDWPPIFTPMYAMFQGAIAHTIELPLRVNNSASSLPITELRRRANLNTAVAAETIRSALRYTDANRDSLIATQIEQFRRGVAGEQRREPPIGFVPGFGPEDQGYVARFPRAYVLPAEIGQRSVPATARLVDHLVANGIRVTRAELPFRAGNRWYLPGSYVVDMHQPLRGLANSLLSSGQDISERVPQMYDVSAWSLGLLWGSTVDVVPDGELRVRGREVTAAARTGAVLALPNSPLRLRPDDPADVAAVHELLDRGVGATLGADGSVLLPASARRVADEVARRYNVRILAAGLPGWRPPAGTPLRRPVVAAAIAGDELQALTTMRFDVRPVSTATLNGGASLAGVDVLMVSSGLSFTALTEPARAEVRRFLAGGGGVVTRGVTGAAFNRDAGLLTATAQRGRSDANGVVRLTGSGPVTGSAPAHGFVYGPLWFTGLGPEVVVEQSYGAGNPLVAGHWQAAADGTNGPRTAAGQPAVVRGLDDSGAPVVLFGTEPLFRAHPQGVMAQTARALFWASTSGAPPVD